MDIPMEWNYEDTTVGNSLIIHFKPGLQTLNGEDAVKFLRFRKGYKNADLGRVQAQQQFIGAFLRELKKPEQWVKAPGFLGKIPRQCRFHHSLIGPDSNEPPSWPKWEKMVSNPLPCPVVPR